MIGIITTVEARYFGGALTADVATGQTVLPLDVTLDYDEDGAFLSLNDVVYEYDTVDDDTVTLTTPLLADAATDDRPWVLDANNEPAVVWVVNVDLGDDGDAVPALIDTPLIGFFAPEGDGLAGQPIDVHLDPSSGTWHVISRPGQVPVLDGDVVAHPHASRRLNALTVADTTWTEITSWTDVEVVDITVSGADHTIVYPGWYFIGPKVAFAANASGRRYLRVLKNGDTVEPLVFDGDPADPGAAATFLSSFGEVRLVEGDVVTLEVHQTSGAGLALSLGPGRSTFSIHRISV